MSIAMPSDRQRVSGERLITAVAAIVWLLLAIGLYAQSSLVTWIWPWDDARMTYIFFSSIAAAVAGPLAWIAWEDEPPALAGTNLNGVMIGGLVTGALVVMAVAESEWRLVNYAVVSTLLTIAAASVFHSFHGEPVRDRTPQPVPVRIVFAILVLILLPLGTALMLRVDGVFPWTLPGHTSTMIGGMFIGASAYFAYGFRLKSWAHSGGQLAGLLAYGIVLAVPYWQTVLDKDSMSGSGGYQSFPGQVLSGASEEVNQTSLYIYTATITVAALFSIYYLFVRRDTRMFKRDARNLG